MGFLPFARCLPNGRRIMLHPLRLFKRLFIVSLIAVVLLPALGPRIIGTAGAQSANTYSDNAIFEQLLNDKHAPGRLLADPTLKPAWRNVLIQVVDTPATSGTQLDETFKADNFEFLTSLLNAVSGQYDLTELLKAARTQ